MLFYTVQEGKGREGRGRHTISKMGIQQLVQLLFLGCLFLCVLYLRYLGILVLSGVTKDIDKDGLNGEGAALLQSMVGKGNNDNTNPMLDDNGSWRIIRLGLNLSTTMTTTTTLLASDIVELDHCTVNETNVPWTEFLAWANRKIGGTIKKIRTSDRRDSLLTNKSLSWREIRDEWKLELLEMHATHHQLCNFSKYHPTVPADSPNIRQAGTTLRKIASTIPTPPNHARIAFVIIAYQDAEHLRRLVKALWMAHHLIVIHLERSTSLEYARQVQELITKFHSNVVVIQFGTVLYKTDSVSMINLRIMHWLVHDLHLQYDFHVCMGGAVFPLYGASELARHLYAHNATTVWLGETTYRGRRVHHPQAGVLLKKRLVSTKYRLIQKLGTLYQDKLPVWLNTSMQHKSASGNQAVYRYSTVLRLLENPQVMEMFAMAKYGCCCCIEERTWIAAMDLLGLLDDAKHHGSTWQAWGGTSTCGGSMHNAVLTTNVSTCFRLEYVDKKLDIWGNETMDHLIKAKEEGFLFARKFRSEDKENMALLQEIQRRLHQRSSDEKT